MRRVAVIGVGVTQFGRHERTSAELFAEAAADALADAEMPAARVQALYYGNVVGGETEKQLHTGPQAASVLGIPTVPTTRFETACASSHAAFRHAVMEIASGVSDVVLVEKPLARTLEEADRMIEAAARAGRVLMTAENFRFMPAFRWVRRALDAGTLGDPREVHLVARAWRRHTGWRLTPGAGGGALIDTGIHYVHALRWWGGEVRRVFALRPPQTIADMAGEDAVDLLAECEGGVIGFLANSLGAHGLPRFQWSSVTGTRATCFVDNRGRLALVRGMDGLRLRLFRRDTRGHEAMLRAFDDAMTTGRATETDGTEGRRDLAVVLAAYRSIAEGRPVTPAC